MKKDGRYFKSQMETESINPRFAICINNNDYPDDLQVRTVYQILSDELAAKSDYIRVIDETGEDYLYPAAYFVFVEVPSEQGKTLILAAAQV
ncbi:MAG: hypothetical protein ABI891_13620 [Acidobacteriota bacterium]